MPVKIKIPHHIRRIKYKLYLSLMLILIVIGVGIGGYMWLSDDYDWIDALYMTVITVTTVGFGEVHPADDSLKIFTVFLIISSIMIYGFVLSVFTELMTNGQIPEYFKRRKLQKKINQMKNHIIVCGFGRNGRQAVERLHSYNKQCVVIESDPRIIEELEDRGIACIKGDATDDEILLKAMVEEASFLITALPSDADNLFVVLSAKQLNPDIVVISRASNDSSYKKLKVAGADNIIMPDKIGGNHMASLIVTPDLVEFVERLSISGNTSMNLEEISVDQLPAEYTGKTLKDLNIRHKTGCLVIGLKTPDKEYIINPDASLPLEPGVHLIILGNSEQIERLRETY